MEQYLQKANSSRRLPMYSSSCTQDQTLPYLRTLSNSENPFAFVDGASYQSNKTFYENHRTASWYL